MFVCIYSTFSSIKIFLGLFPGLLKYSTENLWLLFRSWKFRFSRNSKNAINIDSSLCSNSFLRKYTLFFSIKVQIKSFPSTCLELLKHTSWFCSLHQIPDTTVIHKTDKNFSFEDLIFVYRWLLVFILFLISQSKVSIRRSYWQLTCTVFDPSVWISKTHIWHKSLLFLTNLIVQSHIPQSPLFWALSSRPQSKDI